MTGEIFGAAPCEFGSEVEPLDEAEIAEFGGTHGESIKRSEDERE